MLRGAYWATLDCLVQMSITSIPNDTLVVGPTILETKEAIKGQQGDSLGSKLTKNPVSELAVI